MSAAPAATAILLESANYVAGEGRASSAQRRPQGTGRRDPKAILGEILDTVPERYEVGRAGGLRAGLRNSRDRRRRTARCFYFSADAITLRLCAQASSPVLAPPTRPLRWRNGVSGRNPARGLDQADQADR